MLSKGARATTRAAVLLAAVAALLATGGGGGGGVECEVVLLRRVLRPAECAGGVLGAATAALLAAVQALLEAARGHASAVVQAQVLQGVAEVC